MTGKMVLIECAFRDWRFREVPTSAPGRLYALVAAFSGVLYSLYRFYGRVWTNFESAADVNVNNY